MTRITTSVLVVGAGPVGITLAMDLAWRGLDVVVAELCHRGELPGVKCNHVAARSMEIFRRLGVAPALRDAGLPADYPNDIAFRTTVIGKEFGRIPIPCRRDRYTSKDGPDTNWPTPEPPHRINQIYLEPILHAHAQAMPNLQVLYRTRVTGFTQDADGVVAQAEDLASGETLEIGCAYMVGCEGPQSPTRRAIGAKLSGDVILGRTQTTYFRAPALIGMMQGRPAWSTQCMNPRRSANMFAIDGRETWLIHNYLRPDEADFAMVDRDQCIRMILGVGPDFHYEILAQEDWIGRRMLADRFRDRRVFICGDAAHIWVPFGGYGMNAGIADAMNLSWQIAGVMNGWADAAILDAYTAERHPITEQVSRYAMNTASALARQRAEVPAGIEDESPDGERARRDLGRILYDINIQQFCCGGLNFGYFYDASPIIAYDGETAPGYTMGEFTPSTVPGCRTPHIPLPDGGSLYDALGPDYSLLRLDPGIEVGPIVEAARRRGVPLKIIDIKQDTECEPYAGYCLVLSRPDQHIAWRGNAVPADPLGLIDLVRGAQGKP